LRLVKERHKSGTEKKFEDDAVYNEKGKILYNNIAGGPCYSFWNPLKIVEGF